MGVSKADIVLGAGWLAIVAATVGVFVMPSMHRERELKSEVSALESELAQPSSGPELIAQLQANLDTLQSFGDGRMTDIPEESDIAGLMRSLTDILSQFQLPQHDLTTRPEKALQYASAKPVSISLTGPFTSIYQAVNQIESLPRLVRVERFRLTRPPFTRGTLDRSGVVDAEIWIDAFYAPVDLAEVTPGGEGEAR